MSVWTAGYQCQPLPSSPFIEKQLQRFGKQRFKLLTTSSFLTVIVKKNGGRKCGTTQEREGSKAKEVLREAKGQTYAPFLARWQNDDVYRASQVEKLVAQTKKVIRMDERALADHHYQLTRQELCRYRQNWTNRRNTGGTSPQGKNSGKNQSCTCRSYDPASQNPNRGRRRSSSSKRGEHGGAMICGTPDRLGAKIHGVSGVIRHPNSLCTEH